MKKFVYLLVAAILFCAGVLASQSFAAKEGGIFMKLQSTAFKDGEMIPGKYSCDRANVSPPLSWNALQTGTKSLVLICDDPDAPGGTWVHWVYYDIPPETTGLPENVATLQRPQIGGAQGKMILEKSAMAAHARPVVPIDIILKSTPLMSCLRCRRSLQKQKF
jgi:phosphatidylethanolamine-binding protein (PEBP) family uncharacterized protein